MKNKFIALALVSLVVATTTVSCTKDDLNPTDVKQNVETTTVDFAINAEGATTGKMTIDRSAAPAIVNEVTIYANSAYGPAYTALQSFDFGTGAGLPTGFSLPGVALGTNTFGAHSTGADSDQRLSLGPVIVPSSSSNVLDVMKAHTPYVRCSEVSKPTAVIVKGTNAPINITMKTDYGRILARFVQEAPDADNYIATVTATAAKWDDNLSYVAPYTLPTVDITPTTGFEWSNADALFIEKATFVIKIYDKTPNGAKGALLNTITKEVQIAKATTKLCTFTIKNTDVETNIETGGIVLTFPTIGEEVIND